MDRTKILVELICEHLGVDHSQISTETSFAEDLGADSLDVAELAIAVEDRFGIRIDDEELESIRTVGQAVEMLNAKLSTRRASSGESQRWGL